MWQYHDGALVRRVLLSLVVAITLTSCDSAREPAPATPAPVAVEPPASVKAIMVQAIEPASNALWALALEENAPQTDADWQAVEQEAIQLLAATSAISIGGSGPQDSDWAQQREWQAFSQQMADITLNVLQAARARDYQATVDAGNRLVEPCGACHTAFPGESEL